MLQQRIHYILEVHQAQPGLQVGTAVPRLEADTDRRQYMRIAALACRAKLQQIRHHLVGQVHMVVHHHPLQIPGLHRPGFLQPRQTVQGKARTRPQGHPLAADHRRETGQRRCRVDQPRRIVGVLHVIAPPQLRQLVGREDAFLRTARRDIPGAFTARAVEHDQLQACAWITALLELGGIHVWHHRLVHVQGLALVVRRQGIDPRDALDLVYRCLERLQIVGQVHCVPLLQHPGIVLVGIAQAEGHLVVPVQLARPLHHRPEGRAVHLPCFSLAAAIGLAHLNAHGVLVHRHRFAVQHIAGRVLGIELQPIQGEMLGCINGVGPGQVLAETDVDDRQARQCGAHHIELARDGQMHLVETHAAHPGEVRVGQ
ncbi:hypothetical protein D3C80_707230 [compost metagenome]